MLQYLVPSQTQRNLDVHNARYSRNYQAPVALGVLGTDVSNAGCRLLLSRAGGDCTLERGSWWRRGIGAARTSPATTSAHRLLLLPAAACPAHDRPLQTRTGTQRRGFCRQRRCRGRGRGQESRAPRPGPRGGLVGHCAAHRPRPVQLRAPNWPWRGPWLVQRAVPVAACL